MSGSNWPPTLQSFST